MSVERPVERVMVTGGAGFIGSALVRYLIGELGVKVLNLDLLTYAGNLESLEPVESSPGYRFVHGDIADRGLIRGCLSSFAPQAVVHLAAESHVDRSIDGPEDFIGTNIVGTFRLLQECVHYWQRLDQSGQREFRFHHVSTDEVFGSLGPTGLFTETSAYLPNSPYAASKAASDHLARAWHKTFGLPVITTNCSNNYGPYQFPEKLIPLMILNCLERKPLPVYGDGANVRDWLYVEDHARAIWRALVRGRVGETYNVGGMTERTNLEVVTLVCGILDELRPMGSGGRHRSLMEFVADRPGHDRRYAIDASKMERELDWTPRETFESGLRKTVEWYLSAHDWCQRVQDGSYQRQRLGLGEAQ